MRRDDTSRWLRDVGILSAGISELVVPYLIVRPDPNFHLVIFTTRGEGQSDAAPAARALRPGDVWTSPAHHPQRYRAAGNWSMFWFHLDDAGPWAFLREREPSAQPAIWAAPLQAAMEGYLAESLVSSPPHTEAVAAYARLIETFLRRELKAEEQRIPAGFLKKLQDLWRKVDADLARPWRVADLAREVGVSPVHLHRLTAQQYDATPMRIVEKLRMRRAESLLRHSNDPLKLLAERLGYQTPFAFSKAFKRHTSLSPQTVRHADHA